MQQVLFLLLIFIQTSLLSQFNTNYELLDHSANIGTAGAYKVLDDKVIYVSHNRTWPMTEVKIAYNNNNVDTIYTTGFSSQSMLLEKNGQTQIILYSLFDYDIGAPGFIVIDIENENTEVNSYLTEWDFNDFNNNYFPNNFDQDSTGALFTIQPYPLDSLAFYQNGLQVRKLGLPAQVNRSYSNSKGDIYLYDRFQLYYFDGNQLDSINVFNEEIIDIKSYQETNMVLLKGNIALYNQDFSSEINSWEVSELVQSFYQVKFHDNILTYAYSEDESHQLFTIDQGVLTSKSYPSYTPEVLHGINLLNNDQLLVYGISRLEPVSNNLYSSLTSNPFFRSYDNVEQNYEREDVDLDDVKLVLSKIDTFDTTINFTTGDSIYLTRFVYEAEVNLTNNLDHLIEHLDIYAQPFDVFSFFNNFLLKLDQPLQAFESQTLSKELSIYYTDKSDFKFAIPGANYRFNGGEDKVTTSVLSVSTNDIDYSKILKIYPNPASDIINIKSENAISNISVYNMNGQLLMMESSHDKINTIDVSHLSEGTYIIGVVEKSSGNSVYSKFVKF